MVRCGRSGDDDTRGFFARMSEAIADITDIQVAIPKRVKLQNKRINLLYFSLQFIVLLLSVMRFMVLRQWTMVMSDARVGVTLRGGEAMFRGNSLQSLWEASDRVKTTRLCDRAASPYEVDSGGMKASASCLPICGARAHASTANDTNCVSAFELLPLHSRPQDVLFLTGISSTGVSESGAFTRKFFLTPYEDEMDLSFGYLVTVPSTRSSLHGLTETLEDFTAGDTHLQLTSAEHLSTRLLDRDGSVVKIFGPGEEMTFTLSDVLALAGEPDFLRESTGGMPSGHLLGLQVQLKVTCKFTWGSYTGQECDAEFTSVKSGGADRSRLTPDGGLRSYYGIHVSTSTSSCDYEVFSLESLFLAFLSLLVLWRIPVQCVSVFCRFCLGHTSKIYNRVIIEQFDVRDYMVGLLLRLMIGSQYFKTIAGNDGVIDCPEMAESMQQVFHTELGEYDDDTLTALATLCWRAMVPDWRRKSQLNSDAFNSALIAHEAIRVDDILYTFAGGGKKGLLELMFLPPGMRREQDPSLSYALGMRRSKEDVDEAPLRFDIPPYESENAIDPTLEPPQDQSQDPSASQDEPPQESETLNTAVGHISEMTRMARELAELVDMLAYPVPTPGAEPEGTDLPQSSCSDRAAPSNRMADAQQRALDGNKDSLDSVTQRIGMPSRSINEDAQRASGASAGTS